MELQQLAHFIAVAEERSFTRAARRVHIVQSGLSMSIRALERNVGVRLFRRTTRGVDLTEAGLAMLPEARRAIAAVNAARVAVGSTEALMRGTLRVGVSQASDARRVASLLGRFHETHPGVAVQVQQGNGTTLIEAVAEERLDIAMCGRPIVYPTGVTTIPLMQGAFIVACPESHPLASREHVALRDLASERFIAMSHSWVSRQYADRAFGLAGINRMIVCELDDVALLLRMVEDGLGIAVIAGVAAPVPAGVKFVPIRPAMPEWQFVIAYLGEGPASAGARAFLSMAMREWRQ